MVSAWKHIKIVMRKNACELQIPFRPAGLVRVSSVYGGDNILFIAQSYHFFLSLSLFNMPMRPLTQSPLISHPSNGTISI